MVASHAGRHRATLVIAAAVAGAAMTLAPDLAAARPSATETQSTVWLRHEVRADGVEWAWPLPGAHRVAQAYQAPASRYQAGHRGIDLPASSGAAVASPAAGVVHFAGVVVDRSVVTVETPDGVLISMEPLATELHVGETVEQAQPIGQVAAGGHCGTECLHLGVRVAGEYVSPLRFFGGVPRAVLLPLR